SIKETQQDDKEVSYPSTSYKPETIQINNNQESDINKHFPSKRSIDKLFLSQYPIIGVHGRMDSSGSSVLSCSYANHPYKSFVLMYRSELIVKQFCLIERNLLLNVQWDELVDISWTKDDEKIACDWVATEIVLTRDLEERALVIEKFIRIAQKCLQLSNFATLVQILLGLQSPPVERLHRTWTRVRTSEMRILKELNEYISPFGNWKVIRDAMRLYLSDLVFNSEIPSYIDPTPTPSPSPFSISIIQSQPLINFHKHRTTATISKRVMAFQNLSLNYNFPIESDVYNKCATLKGVEATKLVVMDLDVEDYV
ncbi:10661_t:CDS:2, partial [Diversispora eburnea]